MIKEVRFLYIVFLYRSFIRRSFDCLTGVVADAANGTLGYGEHTGSTVPRSRVNVHVAVALVP